VDYGLVVAWGRLEGRSVPSSQSTQLPG